MPSAMITEPMPFSTEAVFDLLHDYSRRLEWDTLLREARFTRGHTTACVGATTLCVGRALFGIIGVETEYVSFERGVVAAVRMINQPPFFRTFAASIRHQNTADTEGAERASVVTYKLHFSARPRWLAWLIEPVMLAVLTYETRRRLRALANYAQTLKHSIDR